MHVLGGSGGIWNLRGSWGDPGGILRDPGGSWGDISQQTNTKSSCGRTKNSKKITGERIRHRPLRSLGARRFTILRHAVCNPLELTKTLSTSRSSCGFRMNSLLLFLFCCLFPNAYPFRAGSPKSCSAPLAGSPRTHD